MTFSRCHTADLQLAVGGGALGALSTDMLEERRGLWLVGKRESDQARGQRKGIQGLAFLSGRWEMCAESRKIPVLSYWCFNSSFIRVFTFSIRGRRSETVSSKTEAWYLGFLSSCFSFLSLFLCFPRRLSFPMQDSDYAISNSIFKQREIKFTKCIFIICWKLTWIPPK